MKALNKEEKDVLKSYDRNEWKSAKGVKSKFKSYSKYASETFRKDSRINIRISTKDLERLQTRALSEGLPYQTLISSILHKFVSARMVEKPVQ
ncbi:MAG: antitoxin [Elusimicrobia bacterium CG03_land_8_20_14_0_80_50_18]|nr:MAG: antitoxin [Elusimicrobia bacterium CG03_land_8_20_14_0_80_50_18]